HRCHALSPPRRSSDLPFPACRGGVDTASCSLPRSGGRVGWGQVAVCLSCGIAVPPPGLPPRAGGGVDGGALLPPPLAGEGWGGGRLPRACHAGARGPLPAFRASGGGVAGGAWPPPPRGGGGGGGGRLPCACHAGSRCPLPAFPASGGRVDGGAPSSLPPPAGEGRPAERRKPAAEFRRPAGAGRSGATDHFDRKSSRSWLSRSLWVSVMPWGPPS